MLGVRVRDNESFESAVRRFKRTVEKAGVLTEVKKRECYIPPSKLKQRAVAAAAKRFRKKQQRDNKEFEDSGHGGRRGNRGGRH